ncbi:GFA family protein [Pseudomonas cavernicola]|uniref:GFA family protein n=1 Tax=Pseudomonas cavernicola TaxID=2320866 RepID=A0A418XB08_9PSED|nr:GFA family protein [Pseudomonas cavernicola]RJG09692.1 GFA family protein [Pseudomonas cavernicola]
MYQGSCLCSAVRFEIAGELEPIQICHCSLCRKAQGVPFVTNIPVSTEAFRLLSGADALKAFSSSPGKQRVFCSHCGSPIYSQNQHTPGVLRIRAGTLEGELKTRPMAHFYIDSKANWWELSDDLPKYAQGYLAKT